MIDHPLCPNCFHKHFCYVQRAVEYHIMESLPDAQGYTDLAYLFDSTVDPEFHPYLECMHCHHKFTLQGEPFYD